MLMWVNRTDSLSPRHRVRRHTLTPWLSCYACLTMKRRFC